MSIPAILEHLPDAAERLRDTTLAGTVEAVGHPAMPNRVRVTCGLPDGSEWRPWLPRLQGLVVREGDRVLVTVPSNAVEAVVTGVIDHLEPRVEPPRLRGPALRLEPDEALVVAGPDGTPWLELAATPEGPRVRLLVPAEGVSVDGPLRLSGDSVELEARRGEVTINASGDVRVIGEIVQLNC